ncbi:hypothetical protein FOD75_11285 (plasmid) [Limosilactobacillus reuteri]|uniref:Uncharacterized protein n=1 Tax=Limosilactobacillus reuteri TaxID=1598 RepID=A0A517D8J9_LIMRT|nr:hypothetical protein FOD75_11285 [Limosilactobacillus reuteri]
MNLYTMAYLVDLIMLLVAVITYLLMRHPHIERYHLTPAQIHTYRGYISTSWQLLWISIITTAIMVITYKWTIIASLLLLASLINLLRFFYYARKRYLFLKQSTSS